MNCLINTAMHPGRFLLLLTAFLSGCSVAPLRDGGPRPGSVDVSNIPDARPKVEPLSKYGNPPSYEVLGRRYYVMNSSKGYVERGIASWYGKKFHGRRTSSGETYDMYKMTAAHRELPLPTYVKVTNLRNGRQVIVKVNDRGPFHENRIIDLSYSAAAKLGIIKEGTGLVEVRAIDPGTYQREESTLRTAGSLPVDSDSGFYIQVGAFSELANAINMRNRLDAISMGAIRISEARIKDSHVYRVRIGPINNVDVADRIVSQLGRFGVFDHHIVVE